MSLIAAARRLPLALVLCLAPSLAGAQLPWSSARFLNEADANADVRQDRRPRIAGSGDGTFLAVWQAQDPVGMALGDTDVFAALSADGGATWSAPFTFYNPANDGGEDRRPHVATDGSGTWIIAWGSDANHTGNSGGDFDIAYVRSTDNGATWSPINHINGLNVSDGVADDDEKPVLAYSGGRWLCAWESNDGALTGEAGSDFDIVFAASGNGGSSWTPAGPVDTTAGSEAATDTDVALASDGKGNWAAVWTRARLLPGDPGELDSDVLFARSISGGLSWLPAALATPGDPNTPRLDFSPRIAHAQGVWLTVFHSNTDWTGDSGVDFDIFAMRTKDLAVGWSAPALVNDTGAGDAVSEFAADIATDGLDTFVAAYTRSDESEPAPNGQGSDVYLAVSTDRGATWGKSVAATPVPGQDLGPDQDGAVAADGAGNWIAAFATENDLTGESEADSEIALLTAAFTGAVSVEGVLFDRATGQGLTCAAVEAVNRATQELAAVATTDRNGYYAIGGLAPGTYRLRMRPVGYPQRIRNVTFDGSEPITLNESFLPSEGGIAIFGTVTDADSGAPLPEVQVTAVAGVRTAVTYTCAEGRYEFTLAELFGAKGANTEVELEFEAEGYDPATATADVPPEGGAEADQTMSKLAGPGTLAGLVIDADTETPLSNALVTIGGTLNVSDTTGQDGTYLFAALPAGSYSVHASKEGYEGETANIPVPDGAVAARNFALGAEPAAPISPYDLNGDGLVNAIDIQLAINAALGLDLTIDADANDDGATNAVDIQLVINAALGLD